MQSIIAKHMKRLLFIFALALSGCSRTNHDQKAENSNPPKYSNFEAWMFLRSEMLTLLSIKHGIQKKDGVQIAWEYYINHDSAGRFLNETETSRNADAYSFEGVIKHGELANDTIQRLATKYDLTAQQCAGFIVDVRNYDELLNLQK